MKMKIWFTVYWRIEPTWFPKATFETRSESEALSFIQWEWRSRCLNRGDRRRNCSVGTTEKKSIWENSKKYVFSSKLLFNFGPLWTWRASMNVQKRHHPFIRNYLDISCKSKARVQLIHLILSWSFRSWFKSWFRRVLFLKTRKLLWCFSNSL